jgi:hypothetical protein
MKITWQCLSCEEKPEFTGNRAVIDHLQTVHGVPDERIKGVCRPEMFMDGKGFAINTYRWWIGSKAELIQTVEVAK